MRVQDTLQSAAAPAARGMAFPDLIAYCRGSGAGLSNNSCDVVQAVHSILEHLSVHASGYLLGVTLILTGVLLLRLTLWRRRPPPSNELFR
jgi:hypothetical protein